MESLRTFAFVTTHTHIVRTWSADDLQFITGIHHQPHSNTQRTTQAKSTDQGLGRARHTNADECVPEVVSGEGLDILHLERVYVEVVQSQQRHGVLRSTRLRATLTSQDSKRHSQAKYLTQDADNRRGSGLSPCLSGRTCLALLLPNSTALTTDVQKLAPLFKVAPVSPVSRCPRKKKKKAI